MKSETASEVKERIRQHPHFTSYHFKLYFTEPLESSPVYRNDDSLLGPDEVLAHLQQHRDNVLVETLVAGRLGLPDNIEEVFSPPGSFISILHPSILILTKVGRWAQTFTSTRPKTKLKSKSDEEDLDFLISWLVDRNLTISFDTYRAEKRPREKLLRDVRTLWDKKILDLDEPAIVLLKQALTDADREQIMADQTREGNLAELALSEDTRPPID